MRIHRLEVEAFGPFAEAQHIDFDQLSSQGLFLLNGATGAGKTSILDAICFALYGAVPGARQESKRLRSDHAAPTAEPRVVCEFSARGRRFEVTRTPAWDRPSARGRNGFTTQQAKTLLRERIAGDWQEKSSRNDEVGAELSDVLGMDREQFTRVVMLPQGDFAAFLRSKASDRLELLQKLFGTERFEAVERRLSAQASEAARAVGDNEAQLNVLLGRAAAERAHLGLVSGSGPGSSGSQSASEAHSADWSGREPGEWLGEVEAEIAAEHERRAEQAGIAESSSIRAAEKLQEDQDKAQRHNRLSAANQRRVLLELATPRAFEDKERLARHRRAAGLRGQLEAVDNAARRHKAALAAEEAVHARLESAGLRAASIESALESVKGTMAVLEARLPDEQRLEETGARLEAQEAQLAKSSAAAEAAAGVRLDLVAQESALQEEAAPLESVAARAEEATRAAEAAAGIVELVSRYSLAEAERDGLRAQFSEARSHNQDLRQTWLDLREARLANAAGELAAALVDGEACAVCGSTEHPHPADAARSALSLAQEEEDAGLAYEASDKVLNGIAEQLAAAEQLVAGLAAQGGATDPLEAEAHLASARAEAKEAQAAAARLKVLARKQDELKLHMEKVAEDHSSALAAAGQASSLAALLKEQYSGLQTGLSELAGDYPSLKSRLQALSEERGLLQSAADAAREVQHAGRAWEDAQAALKDALPDSGFPTAEEAQRGLLPASDVVALEESLNDHENEAARLEELFGSEDLVLASKEASIGERPLTAAQLLEATTEVAAAEKAARELALSAGLAAKALQTVRRIRSEYLERAEAGREPRERARVLAGLADTLRGSGENNYRMSLNSYVLAARLEQVAVAASERLVAMTDGRYTLRHSDAKAARGAKSGLGLEVVDQWTGQRRDTSTLSGGESFMASLSLALGLADVVQLEAGGVDIETLFVDEGFGSLDEQALEQVMDALEGLRDGGRVVGLVSHVAEMKQRISSQLQVVKGRNGSTVRIVEAMPA